jgi:hypothetical protein
MVHLILKIKHHLELPQSKEQPLMKLEAKVLLFEKQKARLEH